MESPVCKPFEPENLIYVNSILSSSFSGRANGGEYTAILLAFPKAGTYSGQFSIKGNGSVLSSVNEAVTFSFKPFDTAAYKDAGGQLKDCFASMSVLQTAGGTYILLLDGDQVVLEATGKVVCFCGSLPSTSEYSTLQNEAAKTRKMLSYLYRQKSNAEASLPDYSGLKNLDPNNPEDLQKLMDAAKEMNAMISNQNTPAWYSERLIPTVNFSADDGFNTIPSATGLLFRIYTTNISN